jgi:hypothetical protein
MRILAIIFKANQKPQGVSAPAAFDINFWTAYAGSDKR